MHIVNELKKLINDSRLFVHQEKLEKAAGKKRRRKDNVKIGQGGTLDPLADGVLGQYFWLEISLYCPSSVNTSTSCSGRCWKRHKETKRLLGLYQGARWVCVLTRTCQTNVFQEYRTTCLLGCETDTYDSEGARVRMAPWRHVTRDKVEDALVQFRGEIQQTPPMCVATSLPV